MKEVMDALERYLRILDDKIKKLQSNPSRTEEENRELNQLQNLKKRTTKEISVYQVKGEKKLDTLEEKEKTKFDKSQSIFNEIKALAEKKSHSEFTPQPGFTYSNIEIPKVEESNIPKKTDNLEEIKTISNKYYNSPLDIEEKDKKGITLEDSILIPKDISELLGEADEFINFELERPQKVSFVHSVESDKQNSGEEQAALTAFIESLKDDKPKKGTELEEPNFLSNDTKSSKVETMTKESKHNNESSSKLNAQDSNILKEVFDFLDNSQESTLSSVSDIERKQENIMESTEENEQLANVLDFLDNSQEPTLSSVSDIEGKQENIMESIEENEQLANVLDFLDNSQEPTLSSVSDIEGKQENIMESTEENEQLANVLDFLDNTNQKLDEILEEEIKDTTNITLSQRTSEDLKSKSLQSEVGTGLKLPDFLNDNIPEIEEQMKEENNPSEMIMPDFLQNDVTTKGTPNKLTNEELNKKESLNLEKIIYNFSDECQNDLLDTFLTKYPLDDPKVFQEIKNKINNQYLKDGFVEFYPYTITGNEVYSLEKIWWLFDMVSDKTQLGDNLEEISQEKHEENMIVLSKFIQSLAYTKYDSALNSEKEIVNFLKNNESLKKFYEQTRECLSQENYSRHELDKMFYNIIRTIKLADKIEQLPLREVKIPTKDEDLELYTLELNLREQLSTVTVDKFFERYPLDNQEVLNRVINSFDYRPVLSDYKNPVVKYIHECIMERITKSYNQQTNIDLETKEKNLNYISRMVSVMLDDILDSEVYFEHRPYTNYEHYLDSNTEVKDIQDKLKQRIIDIYGSDDRILEKSSYYETFSILTAKIENDRLENIRYADKIEVAISELDNQNQFMPSIIKSPIKVTTELNEEDIIDSEIISEESMENNEVVLEEPEENIENVEEQENVLSEEAEEVISVRKPKKSIKGKIISKLTILATTLVLISSGVLVHEYKNIAKEDKNFEQTIQENDETVNFLQEQGNDLKITPTSLPQNNDILTTVTPTITPVIPEEDLTITGYEYDDNGNILMTYYDTAIDNTVTEAPIETEQSETELSENITNEVEVTPLPTPVVEETEEVLEQVSGETVQSKDNETTQEASVEKQEIVVTPTPEISTSDSTNDITVIEDTKVTLQDLNNKLTTTSKEQMPEINSTVEQTINKNNIRIGSNPVLEEGSNIYTNSYNAYFGENSHTQYYKDNPKRVVLGVAIMDQNGNMNHIFASSNNANQRIDNLINEGGEIVSILTANQDRFLQDYTSDDYIGVEEINAYAEGWYNINSVQENNTKGLSR